MTIGRDSRKGSLRSSIRAPKFLDKSAGFYCRLDEPSARREGKEEVEEGQREKAEDFSEGGMGDDGEMLLQRKASRRRSSSQWRRSSRRKRTEGDPAEKQGPGGVQAQAPGCKEAVIEVAAAEEEQEGGTGGDGEPPLVHFASREEADDRVLIRHMKRGRDVEGAEERRAVREQEEGMKMVKRMTAKNYGKVSTSGRRSFGQHVVRADVLVSAHICTNSRLRSSG